MSLVFQPASSMLSYLAMLRKGSLAVPPLLAVPRSGTVTACAPSLVITSLPLKSPSTGELNVTSTSTGVLTSVLLCEIVVGDTVNAPLTSLLTASDTSPVRNAPVTLTVLVTGSDREASNFNACGSTMRVGTRGRATPAMGTVTGSTSSSAHESVRVASLLPASVGA